MKPASPEEVAKSILGSGAVEVRDVDGGEQPFVYSTGNRGPGYVMIKGLVGRPDILIFLVKQLALRVVQEATFDFIEGNATGGMIPAWQLRNEVSALLGKEIPYAYLREARKEGGHGELITGIGNGSRVRPGMVALVVEELVNYAGTTTNAARIYREAGFPVSYAACILSYDHEESNAKLREAHVQLIRLITLPRLIEVAWDAGFMSEKKAKSYLDFLNDPVGWQLVRGLVVPKDAAQTAMGRGFNMRELSAEEATRKGAPSDKIGKGVVYFTAELPSGAPR